jgi:hypothetical protein
VEDPLERFGLLDAFGINGMIAAFDDRIVASRTALGFTNVNPAGAAKSGAQRFFGLASKNWSTSFFDC